MTLAKARELVAEFFVVETDAQRDDILCAALRVDRMRKEPFYGDGKQLALWITEQVIRDRLASTRALFGRALGVTEVKDG